MMTCLVVLQGGADAGRGGRQAPLQGDGTAVPGIAHILLPHHK